MSKCKETKTLDFKNPNSILSALKNLFKLPSIFFNTLEELDVIIEDIKINGDSIYKSKIVAIEENFKLVDEYRIPEDWVFKNYPFLFN